MDTTEARNKLMRYCAYQERSQKEVRQKLYDLGIYYEQAEELIAELISENFLNEERFAKAYAGGKFRVKKWGRNKIQLGLKQHDISEYCIQKSLQEIDQQDYLETLERMVSTKNEQLNEANDFVRRNKLAKHAISKGYEPDLVWGIVKSLVE
ncbi:MAG: regulatory protein RecX [Cyclobacteriaceae bacterium]